MCATCKKIRKLIEGGRTEEVTLAALALIKEATAAGRPACHFDAVVGEVLAVDGLKVDAELDAELDEAWERGRRGR